MKPRSVLGDLGLLATLTPVAAVAAAGEGELVLRGKLWNGETHAGVTFAARLAVRPDGGRVRADGDAVQVSDATEEIAL